jgi:hypothetical protein
MSTSAPFGVDVMCMVPGGRCSSMCTSPGASELAVALV